ncbi:MAG: hypothetical protein WCE62_16025 [Polyangiales bacterium]
MKAFARVAFCAAMVLSLALSVLCLDPPEAGARSCYTIYAKADKMGSRYRHTVYVENDCDYWVRCTVWTDANPQPPKMFRVGPGMTEHAETSADSPYDDPKAFGTCRDE